MSDQVPSEPHPLPPVEDLQALYEHYRRAYFDGQLPPVTEVSIEWSSRLTASAGLCKPRQRVIRLSTHYHRKHPDEVGMTLLHEMIHLLVPGHGPAFRQWMAEIGRRGGRVARYARAGHAPRDSLGLHLPLRPGLPPSPAPGPWRAGVPLRPLPGPAGRTPGLNRASQAGLPKAGWRKSGEPLARRGRADRATLRT